MNLTPTPKTCVGTINQTGPFSVIDGTGRSSPASQAAAHMCSTLSTPPLETSEAAPRS